MDPLASALAAFSAGKMPTTEQTNAALDWLLSSPLIQLEHTASSSGGELSANGKVLVKDLREIVEAYKQIGAEKNGDNTLQEALWDLSQGKTDLGEGEEESEAKKDAKAFAGAVKGLVGSVLAFMGGESGNVLADFASFSRGSLADVAEAMEGGARVVKEKLREVEGEVQEGTREPISGISKQKEEEDDMDARQTFEKRMDQVKGVGSEAIGYAQDTTQYVQDVSGKASQRMDDALWKICERAQSDKEYHDQISALFDIAHKWLNKGIDNASAASDADEPSSNTDMDSQLASLVQDPTGKIPAALSKLRILMERFAGGKSLETLYAAAAQCAADVREDEEVKGFFDEWEAYVRKCLNEPGYLRSEECTKKSEELSEKWNTIMDADTDAGKKWKEDVDACKKESTEFGEAVTEDGSLNRLKKAHAALAKDLADATAAAAQVAIGQSQWVLQDVLNVFLPRVFELMKSIPLPRTEYVDESVEFVFENLDLTSLHLLPGHAFLSNTTDVHLDASSSTTTTADISTTTRVKLTGVQLALRNLSFYYQDKTSSFLIGPVTGLVDLTVPPKGIDVDVTLSMLPTLSGADERAKRQGFSKVDDVTVHLNDIELDIKQSNRQILLSVFKPILRAGLVAALKMVMQDSIRSGLEQADRIAFDVHKRAGVFADTGAPMSVSYIGGLVSEIGALSKKQAQKQAEKPGPGLTEGVSVTGVGIVKEVPGGGKVAVGAGPQIISGEKHGPIAPFAGGPGADVEGNVGDLQQAAGDAVQTTKESAQKALGEMKSFKDTVAQKREKEVESEGWESKAFDLPQ